MDAKTILLVEDNPADARLVRELLAEAPSLAFDLTHVGRLAEALERLREEQFDVVLLDFRLPDSQGLETFIRMREEAPDVPIVVLTGLADEDLGTSAVKEGAQDYLVKGQVDGESLARSIRYAIARHKTQAQLLQKLPRTTRGKVLGFIGAKGGVGTTTVVLNVAAVLAKQGKSVVAVELRPDYGTFSAQLGRPPRQNLSYLARLDPDKINERELGACLADLASGTKVLYGPQDTAEFGEIGSEQTAAVIEGLAAMADYAIIDLGRYPSASIREAVQRCDSVVLVTTPEPTSIASGKAVLEMLDSWGIAEGRVAAFVVNITSLFAGLDLREIHSQLGCGIIGVLPSAPDDFLAAHHRGEPLALSKPDSAAAAKLTEMTSRLTTGTVIPMDL